MTGDWSFRRSRKPNEGQVNCVDIDTTYTDEPRYRLSPLGSTGLSTSVHCSMTIAGFQPLIRDLPPAIVLVTARFFARACSIAQTLEFGLQVSGALAR